MPSGRPNYHLLDLSLRPRRAQLERRARSQAQAAETLREERQPCWTFVWCAENTSLKSSSYWVKNSHFPDLWQHRLDSWDSRLVSSLALGRYWRARVIRNAHARDIRNGHALMSAYALLKRARASYARARHVHAFAVLEHARNARSKCSRASSQY